MPAENALPTEPQYEDGAEPRASSVVEPASQVGALRPRHQTTASFQLNVNNLVHVICPHCQRSNESTGLALNLTVGPVPEGMRVLMIRPGTPMRDVVDDVRRTLINDALDRSRNNQARAASLLGMKYTTFHTLARRLGITRVKNAAPHPEPSSEAEE